jgi:hypothetical protein
MKCRGIILILLALFVSLQSWALTRNEVNDIVLNQVIAVSPYNATLVAYSYDPPGADEFLKAGDVVGEFESPDLFQVSEDTWFIWLDYTADRWFVHPTALVFVSDASGEVTVIDTEWFPVINGAGVYADFDTRINSPDIFFGDPNPIIDDNPDSDNSLSPNLLQDGTWAVLVAGPANHPASNADLDAMEDALTSAAPAPAVPAASITKTKGSKANMCTALENLGNQSPPCEKLYFHFTGHGNKDNVYFGDPADASQKVPYTELASKIKATNAGEFCVTIEACKSGGGLQTLRDSLGGAGVTSTDAETNARFTSAGSRFTQAFSACLKSEDADTDDDDKVSYAEAHAWAKTQSAAVNGQNPQLWGLPEVIPTLSEWGIIIFTLLLLAFGAVYIRRNQYVLVMQGADSYRTFGPKSGWITTDILRKILIYLPLFVLACGLLIFAFYGEITPVDVPGILISSAIIAYIWFFVKGTKRS